MLPPKTVDLGDGPIDVKSLKVVSRRHYAPCPRNWSRVQFQIPVDYEALPRIKEWLEANGAGKYYTYHYIHPRSHTQPQAVVVLFESRNDALMFKLKDGFKAWQNTGKNE